jgi:hypothetical protein
MNRIGWQSETIKERQFGNRRFIQVTFTQFNQSSILAQRRLREW